jgi:hypothetical protein
MKTKIAVLAAFTLMLSVAHAATVWTNPVTPPRNIERNIATTNDTDGVAPTTALQGIALESAKSYSVTAYVNTAAITFTDVDAGTTDVGWEYTDEDAGEILITTVRDGCTLRCYLYNPALFTWTRCASTADIAVDADMTSQTFTNFTMPDPKFHRLAYVPVGCGLPVNVSIQQFK